MGDLARLLGRVSGERRRVGLSSNVARFLSSDRLSRLSSTRRGDLDRCCRLPVGDLPERSRFDRACLLSIERDRRRVDSAGRLARDAPAERAEYFSRSFEKLLESFSPRRLSSVSRR